MYFLKKDKGEKKKKKASQPHKTITDTHIDPHTVLNAEDKTAQAPSLRWENVLPREEV